MRALIAFAGLTLAAAAPAAAAEPAKDSGFAIPPEMTDPDMGDTLGKMLGALTRAMLDMPVGEMQAAVEGRAPNSADKARTVRDMTGRDARLERQVESQVAQAVPRMQAELKAMASSLPGMIKALEKATEGMEDSLDRATANIPQPGYPKH
jgi:hypothetical protein